MDPEVTDAEPDAEGEAELPEEPTSEGEADDPEGGTPPPDGTEPPEPGTKAWQDLEKKHPGLSREELEKKVALSYWAQTRELSRLSKATRAMELEVATLKGRFEGATAAKGTPPAEAEPEAPPPEVQELDARISGLTKDDEALAASQLDTLKDLNAATSRCAELRGQIKEAKEAGNEEKVDRLEAKLEAAANSEERLRDKLNASVRERKNIALTIREKQREKDWYQRLHSEAKAKESQEKTRETEQLAQIPEIVDGLIEEAMKPLPADPALREHVREVLRDKTTVDLWKAGQKGIDFDRLDLVGMLKQHVDNYAKANNIAKRTTFKRQSEDAVRTSTPPAPTRPGQTPPAKPAATAPARPRSIVVSAQGALSDGMARARRLLAAKGL